MGMRTEAGVLTLLNQLVGRRSPSWSLTLFCQAEGLIFCVNISDIEIAGKTF